MFVVCTLEIETSYEQEGKTTTNHTFPAETQHITKNGNFTNNKQQTNTLYVITYQYTQTNKTRPQIQLIKKTRTSNCAKYTSNNTKKDNDRSDVVVVSRIKIQTSY